MEALYNVDSVQTDVSCEWVCVHGRWARSLVKEVASIIAEMNWPSRILENIESSCETSVYGGISCHDKNEIDLKVR